MSTSINLQDKAIRAAARYLERRGYDVVETEWSADGGIISSTIDVIARDDDAYVFVDVTATPIGEGGFGDGADRERMELLAASWLKDNDAEGNFPVRFDKLSMIVLSDERALLRHHINAYGEA